MIELENGLVLPVMEEFYTIQGEGFYTGRAAWFIRIGGCDVGCHWCDVKESWNPNFFPPVPTYNVVENALSNGVQTVVITGGEPLNYNLNIITESFQKHNIQCHLETSGSSPLTGQWDWICLSPKRNKRPLSSIYPLANELKVIIENEADLSWAEENALKVNQDCLLYLQPEWSKRESIAPIIVSYIMKNPKWQLSLQTHKYIHIP
ncbi:MAG: 7-carboxy-7-deazaguanine synthase QueE [Bacteroidales bacterium]|nr:7-carboxy-7-deazaguanine synthase QueE [Bacteroidales bacterium]